MNPSRARMPLTRRLTVRIAVVIFVVLVAIDIVSIPFWNALYFALQPEWLDPSFVRDYADFLELPPEEQAISAARYDGSMTWSERFAVYGVIAAYTAVYATILAWFISRLATRRIRKLADQVERSEAGLLGPFEVGGADEIHTLAATMNDMRARIETLVGELRERERLRTEWISGVSHDLRAPLTALSVSIERSRRRVARLSEGRDRDELEQSLAVARLDARRVLDLAEDLLEIASLEIGSELVDEPVPVGELVRSAARSLEPLAEERGIELRRDLAPRLPDLRGDGRRLLRAVENVIVNSVQHAEHRVVISTRDVEGELAITVRDDGTGFPQSGGVTKLEELGADVRRADSNGLGLRVARGVVEAHRGRIEARNLPDGGASVEIRLPFPPIGSGEDDG